jgi:cell division protein FtsX
MHNIFGITGILLLIGVGMGVISSLIAIRRYLKN